MAQELVLIVDDDRATARLCQKVLEGASYRVLTARTPLDALQLLRQNRVDILLSDIRMPEMNGFELIYQAKQVQADLSVLIMTGYGSIEKAIQALHWGGDGLILKPFTNSLELVQSVQLAIEDKKRWKDAALSRVLRPLFDVTESLVAETSPEKLERQILSKTHNLFQASWAGIHLIGNKKKCLVSSNKLGEGLIEVFEQQMDELVQSLLEEEKPLLVNVGGSVTPVNLQQLIQEMSVGSLMYAPVKRSNTLIICAARNHGEAQFTQLDLEMFAIFARQAAVALENAWLYSELKETIHRVEESQQAFLQVEKMAAVGRLVASIAHEINNPLQAVRNCLNLASRQKLGQDQYFKYLGMMEKELDRLVKTVKQMLDFSRPRVSEQITVEISQIVNPVLELLKPQLRDQKIKVHYSSNVEQNWVSVDPGQIEQVIFNVLINSMDAIEGADSSSERDEDRKNIWIDAFSTEQMVHVRVEDSGAGVSESWHKRKFEPFVSTKHDGTGLGLTVCYNIMQKHSGSIEVIPPSHGTGACFEITLPQQSRRESG